MEDQGRRLTIEPNREVLLMSRELQGRVLGLDEEHVEPEEQGTMEEVEDSSPMVAVSRASGDPAVDATVVGKLLRIMCQPGQLVVELRTACDQALGVVMDAVGATGRSYGVTTVCQADPGSPALRLAAGTPSQVEVSSVTSAGICTLTLTFARP